MDSEGPYECKKCSRHFVQSAYSSTAICDGCIEAVAPWKMRATGVGCFAASVLSVLASVAIIIGFYGMVNDEGLMSVVSRYKIIGIVVIALLGGGLFGTILSVKILREAGSKKVRSSTE